MTLLSLLKSEAIKRHLLPPQAAIDAATAFALVRDMPYRRASDREPETILREWQGTCSGKHYLLKALLAELGIPSQVIACTVTLQLEQADLPAELWAAIAPTNGRFVDIHNYLQLQLPEGEMIVDATWPLSTKKLGLTVNETFTLGQNQTTAYPPSQTWVVPEDGDAQAFKDDLLRAHFTPQELAARDAFIETVARLLF